MKMEHIYELGKTLSCWGRLTRSAAIRRGYAGINYQLNTRHQGCFYPDDCYKYIKTYGLRNCVRYARDVLLATRHLNASSFALCFSAGDLAFAKTMVGVTPATAALMQLAARKKTNSLFKDCLPWNEL